MIPDNTINNGKRVPLAEQDDAKDVLAILEKHGKERAALMSILGEIQDKYRYLPESALRMVAEQTGCALVDIYAAATFYHSFSLQPKGKHIISVCLGTACHVRGGRGVADEFEQQLGICAGQTTLDGEFTLETVNCLGACALGPIVLVDDTYFSKVSRTGVKKIIEKTRSGLDTKYADRYGRIFPVNASCSHCGRSLMDPDHPIEGHPSIKVTASFGQKRGWARLSGLYGLSQTCAEFEIPSDVVAELSCPHCGVSLLSGSECVECGAKMTQLKAGGGGRLEICSRSGCDGHTLDLDAPASVCVHSEPAVLGVEVHSSGG